MNEKNVTVLIPAKNAAATIGDTLVSISAVAEFVKEVILVNDRSTDLTNDVAKQTATRLSLPLCVLENLGTGVSSARNTGLHHATGDFIYFLDADDLLSEEGWRVAHQQLLKNENFDLVIGACIDRAGHTESIHSPGSYTDSPLKNRDRYISFSMPLIRTGSAIGRSKYLATEEFPTNLGIGEDTIYWSKVISRTRVKTINEPMMVYSIDQNRYVDRIASYGQQYMESFSRYLMTFVPPLPKEVVRSSKMAMGLQIARRLHFAGKSEISKTVLTLSGRSKLRSQCRIWYWNLRTGKFRATARQVP
ncbi:glycosyltransferase family A protein [Devosia sediminis]|uniref:Glycosyltransferase family 2 protein n=1 Tax=Devosia sediminis TaxID=2798801 RepID=A0A934IQ48_9HYPH|nr:glycosyltransferase family 2 protein [Devosia sediminis]MBJ3783126.1 glycosyltransferase family 2 protein [Devosia sediminis]